MWQAIKGMFTGSISELVDKTGAAIDRLVTSDEERLALANELQKIANDAQKENNRAIEALESEVTERHKNDMASDSWLSKNIRPLTLIFLTVAVTLLAYITVFDTELNNKALEMWIDLFSALLLLVYGFYFGSRGIEKIMDMVTSRKGKIDKALDKSK